MSQRLPIPGSDDGDWGDILNSFLEVSLNSDGTLNPSTIGTSQIQNNAVTNAQLDSATQATIAAVANKYEKPNTGIPSTDLTNAVQTSLSAANTAVQPATTLIGDLSGTLSSPTVARIKGITLPSSSPTSGQVLQATSGTATNWATVTGSGTVSNATTSTPGLIELAGDLGGANTSATVPTLAATINVENIISANTSVAGAAQKANNLSDLTSASTARTSLGLGTAATISTAAGGDLSGTLPSPTLAKIQGTNISAPSGGATSYLNATGSWTTPASGSGSGIPESLGVTNGDDIMFKGTSFARHAPVSIPVESYGVVADAILTTVSVTGAAITGTGFLSSQNGKTIAIPGAGAPLCIGSLSAALSTAAGITALPVNSLPEAMPAGDIFINDSGNTQAFQTLQGAAAGATSIPIVAMIPTYAFTSAATISSPVTTLATTVTYNSATSLTAATAATNAQTNAQSVIGTDDTAAWQACINAQYGYAALSFSRAASLITSTLNLPIHGGMTLRGSSQQGSTMFWGGTGPMIMNGTDDGVAWNSSSDYNGPQNTRLEHLKLFAVANTELLNGEGVYAPGTIAYQDWRGGDLQLDNMWMQGFDMPFFGVKSDVNTWTRVTILWAHNGMYLGPRSDQFTAINLYFEYCDRCLDMDDIGGATFLGCQFVDSGSTNTLPIRIRSAWPTNPSRTVSFYGCWFEFLIGKSATDQIEAFIEVGGANGVSDVAQSYSVTVNHPHVLNNNSPNPHTSYFIKTMNATKLSIEDPSGDAIIGNNLNAFFECVNASSPTLKLISDTAYTTTTQTKTYLNNGTGTPAFSLWNWATVAVPPPAATGTNTLVSGTRSNSFPDITADAVMRLTNIGPSGTLGVLGVVITAGSGFVINSYQPGTAETIQTGDTSKVFWEIVSY